MKFSPDDMVKILLGVLVLIGTPASYFFGKRQELKAAKEKAAADAKNAAEAARAATVTADAAQQNADTALMNAVRQGGVETLKTLLEGAKSISDLTKQVQEQAEQLGAFKYQHAEQIGELRLKYQEEISGLQKQLLILSGEVAMLRKEIEVKDAALSDCAEVRKQKADLEVQVASLHAELEEQKRANQAFLFLWDAASQNKGDLGTVNIAEEAIRRIIKDYTEKTPPESGIVSTVAASMVVQTTTAPKPKPPAESGHDDK